MHGVTQNAVGEMVAICGYKGRTYERKFIVLNGRKQLNLLGRSNSERLGLIARVRVTQDNHSSVNVTDIGRKCKASDSMRFGEIQ